jgi:hypothetical protein
MAACGVQAALITGEHPSKDRHGAFLRSSKRRSPLPC